MVLGDGIRRNIADVEPAERDLLRDAIIKLNHLYYPGSRTETPPGGVSWWFKQDEIHQSTHVHGGPEFLPWHREVTNRFEELLRKINPQLSLHYWDFKQDPRGIQNGNTGGGTRGTVKLFDPNFMGSDHGDIGEPWLSAGFYDPEAGTSDHPDRDSTALGGGPADPPKEVTRPSNYPPGPIPQPTFLSATEEARILALPDFGPGLPQNDSRDSSFRAIKRNFFRTAWEDVHNQAHPYFADISPHDAFRDPFVYLLHSNVDRIYAMWQSDPAHPERLDPQLVYGTESNLEVDVFAAGLPSKQNLNNPVEPWSTGKGQYHNVRPWEPTHENQGDPHDYHDLSVVAPPCYDTLPSTVRVVGVENPGNQIVFDEVPQGETATRAVVFEVFTCGTVTLKVSSGPSAPYSVMTPPGDTVIVNSGPFQRHEVRIWFQFTGTAPGPAPNGSVTIHCVETNKDFVFSIHGSSIKRPTIAVMLVLDQSGSMGWLAGTDATTKRIDVLHLAAINFCQLVQANNAVGMVSFDQTAYPGFNVTTLNGMITDPNLATMIAAIIKLQPQGATSIGNGIALGRNTLNLVDASKFEKKAMVVFTDGLENTDLRIADVAGSLNAQTFAVGLGTAEQVSAGALKAITSQTNGYMLLSGPLSPSVDDLFRLQKYFLQILAGVSNTSIVTDPNGTIFPDKTVRIPFQLSEADIDATTILLADRRGVNFSIQTPAGDIMTPSSARNLGAKYAIGTNMNYYRFTLPLALGKKPAHAGTWYAILQIHGNDEPRVAAAPSRTGIRYSFSAQAFTNIRMDACLSQNSLQPGASLTISATLTEYGRPVEHRAKVRAEVELPDHTRTTLSLSEGTAGRFQASMAATLAGVYRIRVIAAGATFRGVPFTREHLLSAIAIPGGDNPPITSGTSTTGNKGDVCKLAECLLSPNAFGQVLEEHKVDPKTVLTCVETWCKANHAGPTKQELAEREGTA
ncbi:hypothetical protein GP486_004621 [Trichoglossum hirsutum]|uniref:VWFA domain-containing protein n=1 Tax=Trichoglossum hirsutum TaxID=265104 RepID=A0A9P8LAU2_9PEZI|nr:hypothetical protein GP486_004621 [Trichoglossum hirsutum]